MRFSLVLLILISVPCWSQTTNTGRAETKGPCSPANTGNNNRFTINCGSGIGKEQGDALLKILNKILNEKLDPTEVMNRLDEIQNDVKKIIQQQEVTGLLSPADEPIPPNPCSELPPMPFGGRPGGLPSGATIVLLGNSASFGTSFPQTVIKIGDDSVLTMDKIDGRIAISAKLFSRDGRIVAEIEKNQFFINPNNYFRKEHPDEHSLVIFDQEGVEVLNVRFVNPTTIRFVGVIRHPKGTLEISSTHGLFANSICTGESRVAHFYIPVN